MSDPIIKQSIAKRNSNPLREGAGILFSMAERKRTARQIVAANVRRAMNQSADLKTQTQLGKRAGVSQRAVGYLLDPETDAMASPKLATIESVARAFGLEPWQLLIDPETFGEELSAHLQRPRVTQERLAGLGREPLTEKPPAVRGGRPGVRRRMVKA